MTELKVDLSVFFYQSGRTVPENELSSLAPGAIPKFQRVEASLEMSHGDSTFRIGDDFGYLIYNLCITLPPLLLKEGQAHYGAFANPGEYELSCVGKQVEFNDSYGSVASFPATALLEELVKVALRFPDLLERYWPEVPTKTVNEYRQQAEDAAKAIGLH